MIPVPRIERARGPLALLLSLSLAACAVAPGPIPAGLPLFSDASFAPPSERIVPADIFEVSPAMRAYLETRVAEQMAAHGEARGLVEALFKDHQLQLDYDAEYTRTAAQAFDARAGNCLSLAIVTGAMARQIGLEVTYQTVQTSEHWERDGDLLELVGHVNVTVGLPGRAVRTWGFNADRWTVDFIPPEDMKNLVTRPISEARIAAMYMNNRAAEALARKRTDDAYWWLRNAIALDPHFSDLYNTLGVTYTRKGMLPQAESTLRRALSMAPDNAQMWNNLAGVLRREGQVEQAVAIEQQHPASGAAALAAAIDGGLKANASGDYAVALDLFTRALRKSRDNHELHYLLAVTYLNLGDRRRAMEHLVEAQDSSTTARQRSLYASKAELLKSTTSSFRLDPQVLQSR